MRTKVYLFSVVFLLAGLCRLMAQDVVSGVFGYYNLTLLGNSDTIVSVPFARLPAFTALVSSASGNVIQVQGTPGWTSNQFVYVSGSQSNTYYVRIESGALEGRYYDITNSGTNSLTVNLKNDTLVALSAGDQISVVPHWTFGTVFVNGNGIWPTTNPGSHKTEVLIPNINGAGINLSAPSTYYYFTNSGGAAWLKVGSSSTNLNDDILLPNTYMIIRHKIPTNSTFTSYGDVILTKINVPLVINSTNLQDNPLALTRPVQLSPNDTALIASGAFAVTVNPGSIKDKLLVFDNSTTNFNKSAPATYYYFNSKWLKVGNTNDFSTSNILFPGSGFIIRKASGASAGIWTNTPTYTNN